MAKPQFCNYAICDRVAPKLERAAKSVLQSMAKARERKAAKARIAEMARAIAPFIAALFASGSADFKKVISQRREKKIDDMFGENLGWTIPHIQDWTEEVASETTATMAGHIDSIMQELGEAATISERTDAISGLLDFARNRARLIARTSTIWAYNSGAMNGMEELGVAVIEWQTGNDDLVCPFCSALNGAAVKLGDPFVPVGEPMIVEGMTEKGKPAVRRMIPKADVLHPPLHPNCRCTILPVIGEQENIIDASANYLPDDELAAVG